MNLPAAIHSALTKHLGAPIDAVEILAHASTGTMARIDAAGERYMLKWLQPRAFDPAILDPCAAEAHGLNVIAATAAIRVPVVVASGTADASPYLLTEWIETAPTRTEAGAVLGSSLAALHRHTTPNYGLDRTNYCGASVQYNAQSTSWLDFYREQRLVPQMRWAAERGLLPARRQQRLAWLIDHLDRWIGAQPEPPSLIHGDLWGGNWLVAADGEPVLIDPAVSYSHREAELAMCRLFGGFPQTFFDAYDEAWSPLPERAERLPLYQLYHLLNHLNVFGESYGGRVDAVLARYAG